MSDSWNAITFMMLGAIMLVIAVPLALSEWYNVKGIWLYSTNPAYFKLTEGKIVSSLTYTTTGRSRQGRQVIINHYSIEYEFTVDGKSYRSDKVVFDDDAGGYRGGAENYSRKYPDRKIVTVYYDPHDPSLSVLEPEKKGILPMTWLIFLIISVLVSVLSSGYWLIRKAFFPQKPPPPPPDYEEVGRLHRDG